MRPRLRVAIVGGGIGGLALATFLSSHNAPDLEIDIYETAPSLTELGAGVGVWLRTWRILSSVSFADGSEDLATGLARIAPAGRDMNDVVQKAFEFRKGDGGPEGRSFYTMMVPFSVLTLHRADYQQVLAQHAIPPATPHFGKRLVGYGYTDENDITSEILLKFADGSTARADLLIGADGIRSATRGEMYRRLAQRGVLGDALKVAEIPTSTSGPNESPVQEPGLDTVSDLIDPVWSGTNVYRHLIPLAALEARFPGHRAGKGPVVYLGKNKHVIAFPIAHVAAMVNLVAFVSDPAKEGTRIEGAWVRPAPHVDLLSVFAGWEDEVRALLELVESPLLWAIHTLKPLPRFSDPDGRVALLGDAAHAMTPHQGAGGGQAIEDAHVLAALLADKRTTCATLPVALRAYDAVRIPEARAVVCSSRLNGMMYEFNHGWDEGDLQAQDEVATLVDQDEYAPAGGSEDPGTEVVAELEAEPEPNVEEEEDAELRRLQRLAEAIMEIHEWEWASEPAESQPQRAIRFFEELLAEDASAPGGEV
ncbi:hypothetical protein M0805_008043 [Coniferiporia weirii]|nr:hypothetical protein M0805_008043 [Coniferiporia weirii]